MPDSVVIVRIPHETRSRARAIAAVTGRSLQEVIVAAFEKYYAQLPDPLRHQVEKLVAARKRDLDC
jgi:regulator of extracellular matrix RemA (YlzA/DUF370 family)